MNFARFFLVVAALALPFCAGTVRAQTTVRILSGFPPGGNVDGIARIYAQKLAEALARSVVVENRTGAAGQIAAAALKASAPDGNTLMVVLGANLTLYPHTVKTPAYDTLKDFVPIALVGSYDVGLAVSANVPASNLKEWVSWAKASKNNATYSSGSGGSDLTFWGFQLGQLTGVQLVHVPYRGVGPAIVDLVGGQIPAAMLPVASLLPQHKSGKVRMLAHSAGRRASAAPEVPTFKELGYPALEVSGWFAIIAPTGIRPDVVARYHEIITQASRTLEVRERMNSFGFDIREMTPAEIAAMIKAEYDRWGPIVKASGFVAEGQ